MDDVSVTPNETRRSQPGPAMDRVLGLLALAIARRDAELFHQTLDQVRALGLDSRTVREVLLQSYLFCGYPTCIWAFEQLLHHAPDAWLNHTPPYVEADVDPHQVAQRGWRLFRAVYGPVHQRLYEKVAAFHPDLARWMVHEGYGRVLSRAALEPAVRELCIIAILAHTRHEPQLRSHVIGALRLGVDDTRLKAFIEALRPHIDARVVQAMHSWIKEYRRGLE